MDEKRIASLDAVGFDWRLNSTRVKYDSKSFEERIEDLKSYKEKHDSTRAEYNPKSFEERIEDLKAYKEKHGHLNVGRNEDKRLVGWCSSMRYGRKNPEKSHKKLDEERIASLDALGFDWRLNSTRVKCNSKSFEERIEDLKSYKEKHGHLNVRINADKSLAAWCSNMRYGRKSPKKSTIKLDEERMASLDALGFDWRLDNT